jgi:O-antigen ligase
VIGREQIGCLLGAAIFYGLVILIALVAVPYGTVDPWWESIFEAAVFGLTILWLVEGLLRGTWWGAEHRLLIPLLALVLLAFAQSVALWKYDGGAALAGTRLSWTISADPFETRRFAYKLLAIALTLGLLLRYASTMLRLRILVHLVLGVALASAVFGLVRAETPQTVFGFVGDRLSQGASYGQFENRNHFAMLMEMAIGLMLGLTLSNRGHKKRLLLYLLSGMVLWAALLLTHSRGGVLTLIIEVPFFFLLVITFRHSSKPKVRAQDQSVGKKRSQTPHLIATTAFMCLLLTAVGTSVVLVGGDETISRLESTPAEFNARATGPPKVLRPQIWQATLKLIKDHPLLGIGFAGYSMAIPRYLDASGEWNLQQAHNDYLELLASGGLIGSALGLWFLMIFVRTARKVLLSASPFCLAMRCGSLAGLFAVAVHSLFDFGLQITINSLVCLLLIVLAVRVCNDTNVKRLRRAQQG